MYELVIYLEKLNAAQKFAAVMSKMPEYAGMAEKRRGLIVSEDKKTAIVYGDGHCLRLKEPHEYDAKYANRYLRENLPIDIGSKPPTYVPIERKKNQLDTMASALRNAKIIVNAADNDDQGQHIADIIFEHLGIDAQNDVFRILPSALNDTEIKRLLGSLTSKKNNSMYRRGLRARAKAYVDWYFGMNASRLLSTEVRLQGLSMRLNMGTVKTPTLRIADMLWTAYSTFKPVDYFGVNGVFADPRNPDAPAFTLGLPVPEVLNDPVTGYPTDKARVVGWVKELLGGSKVGVVEHFKDKVQNVSPPQPFDTTSCLIAAEKKFGYSPSATSESLQRLYERGLTTYPRTEAKELPGSGENNYKAACRNIIAMPEFEGFVELIRRDSPPANMVADKGSTSEDDESHVAIIPTEQPFMAADLSERDINVYLMIVERFLLQFGIPCKKAVREAKIRCGNALFSGSASSIIERGWKDIKLKKGNELEAAQGEQEEGLPELKVGEQIDMLKAQLSAKKTKRPEKTTQSGLIERMKSAHKLLEKSDPHLAKALEEANGFGTSATREGIVSQLLSVETGSPQLGVEKKTKHILPTSAGRNILKYAPPEWSTLEFAARLEVLYDTVKNGERTPLEVLNKVRSELVDPLIKPYQDNPPRFERPQDEILLPCPVCKEREGMVKKKYKDNPAYWFCIKCNSNRSDYKGAPLPSKESEGEGSTCKKCNKGTMRAKIITLKKDKSTKLVLACDQYSKGGCSNTIFLD